MIHLTTYIQKSAPYSCHFITRKKNVTDCDVCCLSHQSRAQNLCWCV